MLRPGSELSTSDAEALGVSALSFLAAEPERLDRFLALSGLNPSRIRAAARQPGFLASVLEYVASDEPLLVAFAEGEGIHPSRIPEALRRLGRGEAEWAP